MWNLELVFLLWSGVGPQTCTPGADKGGVGWGTHSQLMDLMWNIELVFLLWSGVGPQTCTPGADKGGVGWGTHSH